MIIRRHGRPAITVVGETIAIGSPQATEGEEAMTEQQRTQTNVPQDGASRIIRKLDSIEKKLTLLLWIVALPFVFGLVSAVLSLMAVASG